MCYLWKLLGKGLENTLLTLVLPDPLSLTPEHEKHLLNHVVETPGATGDLLRLGLHYAESGAIDDAEGCFNRILCTQAHHLEARLAWAGLNAAQGQLDTAIAQLRPLSQSHDPRYHYALGYCLERQGQLDEAFIAYHQGCELPCCHLPLHHRAAALHLVREDIPGAIEHLRLLLEDHPEEVGHYLLLGQLHLAMQNIPDAVAMYERALTIEPDNFELHDDAIEALIQSGQTQDAIEQLHEWVQTQGEFPDSFVRLGDLYSQTGDDQAATEHYQKALQLHPGYLEAAVKLGTQHMRMGRLLPAAASFNRAMDINDQLINTYAYLALAERLLDKQEQAEDTLDLAAALEPNTNLLFAEIARLQMRLQRESHQISPVADPTAAQLTKPRSDPWLDEQIRRHRRALQKHGNDAGLHYRMALLLRGRGQTKKALDHLQHSIEINPVFAPAGIKLALARREAGDIEPAWEQIQSVLRPDPHQIKLHHKLALLYCDRLEFSLAVETSQREPGPLLASANTEANLLLTLHMMGLIDSMKATWRALCELDPQSTLAFQAQRSFTTHPLFHS